MTEQKKQKVTSAILSGTITLAIIFVVIIGYQLASIIIKKDKINKLELEIASIEQSIEDLQSEIDVWGESWKIEERARELGMYRENEDE